MARLLAGQGRGARRCTRTARPETLLIEGLTLAKHVVHRPRQPRRQDPQRPARAALRLLLLLPLLGPRALSQKQARRLRERPAQMRVADLLTTRPPPLPRRLVRTPHQPRVRQKLPRVVETLHLMHLVEQDQRQQLA